MGVPRQHEVDVQGRQGELQVEAMTAGRETLAGHLPFLRSLQRSTGSMDLSDIFMDKSLADLIAEIEDSLLST